MEESFHYLSMANQMLIQKNANGKCQINWSHLKVSQRCSII